MTIENPEAFAKGFWDWAILDGCFGDTKIKPTDIDGAIERRGWYLLIETKAPGVELKQGQLLFYKGLLDTGRFTILFVWGETNKPEKIWLWTRRSTIEYDKANISTFRGIVSKWFEFANTTATRPPVFAERTTAPVPKFRKQVVNHV